MVRVKSMEFIWSINGVLRMMRMMTTRQCKRQRKVPDSIYFWLLRKWKNICQSRKKWKGWRRICSHEEWTSGGWGISTASFDHNTAWHQVAPRSFCSSLASDGTWQPGPALLRAGSWPPLTITSSLATTQEAKWAAAHRLTMSPGTERTSPECGMATGGPSKHDLTAF